MQLWRLHIRPTGLNPSEVVDYCRRESLLGVGWGREKDGDLEEIAGESNADYLRRHKRVWGKKGSAARLLLRDVQVGDLIWARDTKGGYLLARAVDVPRKRFGDQWNLRDMYHVVPVRIVGTMDGDKTIDNIEVPGSVIASFASARRAFQRVSDENARKYSDWLFERNTNGRSPKLDLVSFWPSLSAKDLENLVVLWLQEQGWRIVLSSHAPNTPRYEATFVHPEHGTAGVQVKHKGKNLNAAEYEKDGAVQRVFLFAASGNYGDARPDNVTIIGKDELIAFARERRAMLPPAIRYWFDRSEEAR